MKKILVMMLVAAMCTFPLAACGNSSSDDSASETESTYEETASDSAEDTTADSSDLAQTLADKATFAAMGVDEAGETVYLMECGDEFTVLVILDPETSQAVSFVGPETQGQSDSGNPAVQITDEVNGMAMAYEVLDMDTDNGVITIYLGESGGQAVLEQCDPIDVANAIQNINDYADLIA